MTASSPKQRWRRGPRVIRGRSNPGKGAGRRWGNSERRGGGPVEGEDRCSWCSLPRQSGRRVGGRGREGVGRARSTAGRPSGSGRDRNPVKIRVGGRFNHGSVPIGLFLKGDAPLSKRTEPGARGRGPAALGGARQLHGTGDLVGAVWGKALHFTFSSSAGGRLRDARRPSAVGSQVPGPGPATHLAASREGGGPGWAAAVPAGEAPNGRRRGTEPGSTESPSELRQTRVEHRAPRSAARLLPGPCPALPARPAALVARRRPHARSALPARPAAPSARPAPLGAPAPFARRGITEAREPPGEEAGGGAVAAGAAAALLIRPG